MPANETAYCRRTANDYLTSAKALVHSGDTSTRRFFYAYMQWKNNAGLSMTEQDWAGRDAVENMGTATERLAADRVLSRVHM